MKDVENVLETSTKSKDNIARTFFYLERFLMELYSYKKAKLQ